MNEILTAANTDSQRPHSSFEQQFLAYLAQRELRYARCRKTGTALGYSDRAGTHGPDCAVDWVGASGDAILYSFVVYHQAYSPEFKTPYNVAQVELAEGPRLISTIITDNLAGLYIDMPLKAKFEESGRLVFVPACTR
jgi:uncharacterized OB-fold protein